MAILTEPHDPIAAAHADPRERVAKAIGFFGQAGVVEALGAAYDCRAGTKAARMLPTDCQEIETQDDSQERFTKSGAGTCGRC